MKFKEEKITAISLENVKREFEFPFPIKKIGLLRGHLMNKYVFQNKLEIAIRLNSTSKFCKEYVGNTCYTTPFPNAALKVPGIRHQYEILDPRDAFYISYDAKLYDKMLKMRLISSPPVWKITLCEQVNKLISTLLELMQHIHEYGVVDRMDILGFQLLEELLLMKKAKEESEDYVEAGIQRIAHYLQLNASVNINLEKLYEENGFSRRSFYRHWANFYSISPQKYLQKLKLQEAANMLHFSDKKVYEISEQLNFEDSAYFCSLFKKHYGLTPLQYRDDCRS